MRRRPERVGGFAPIGDYGLLGDEHTVALLSLDGAIDWLCLPTFSDPPVFAALLDPQRGGSFRLAPTAVHECERRYLPRTNVIETTYYTDGGVVRVTDALTVAATGSGRWRELVRRCECVSGETELAYRVAPRFGWEQAGCEPFGGEEGVVFRRDALGLLLQSWGCPGPYLRGPDAEGRIQLGDGQSAILALTAFDRGPIARFSRGEIERRLEETREYWNAWSKRCSYQGPWREAVLRSALTLAALVHAPTGGIVAAPTSSLPERIGGDRNYDYRFCWVRDGCFTLDAMLNLGYRNQVHASLAWLLGAIAGSDPKVDVLYGLDGSRPGDEVEKPELRGYLDSRPVQAGNSAAGQLQLGGYGDTMQTAYLFVADGGSLDPSSGELLARVADHAAGIWGCEDSGMWELPQTRHYTQGKLSVWLALRRILELAARGEVPADARRLDLWRREAAAVERYIEERCWSDELGAYEQYPGSGSLDTDMLLATRVGYPHPQRLRAMVERMLERLCPIEGSPLIYRFWEMREREGAFVACSYWLIEALARLGDRERAAAMMEEMVERSNDLGLFSEEIDPSDGSLLGNFPQALSHLSLITAAAHLAGGTEGKPSDPAEAG